ncbi:Proteinase inhibitor [Ralstonia mannitolilytica]|nr:hypothetical protein LMG8323_00588 [Ralstonia mannitolilytica]
MHNSGFCLDVTDSHGHGLPTSLWGMLHRALDLQPDPGMPGGKPAGVRCVQLDEANRCRIFGRPERPAVCGSLRPEPDMCGASAVHAMQFLTRLEAATASS